MFPSHLKEQDVELFSLPKMEGLDEEECQSRNTKDATHMEKARLSASGIIGRNPSRTRRISCIQVLVKDSFVLTHIRPL